MGRWSENMGACVGRDNVWGSFRSASERRATHMVECHDMVACSCQFLDTDYELAAGNKWDLIE